MKTSLTFDEVYGSRAALMIVAHDKSVQRIPQTEAERSSLPWSMGVVSDISDEDRERLVREFNQAYHGDAAGNLVFIGGLHRVPGRIGFAYFNDEERIGGK